MKKNICKVLSIGILMLCVNMDLGAVSKYRLDSPNGKVKVEVLISDDGVTYSVIKDGVKVLSPSPVSITVSYGADTQLVWGPVIKGKKIKYIRSWGDSYISSPFYKRARVKERYNEMKLSYRGYVDATLVFRAYDDGVAYRHMIASELKYRVKDEQADFVFPENYKIYIPYTKRGEDGDFISQFENSFENVYTYDSITALNNGRLGYLPVLVELPGGKKACITEADLKDYPGMYLLGGYDKPVLTSRFAPRPKRTVQGGHNMLQQLVTEVNDYIAPGSKEYPWRIVALSDNDAELAASDFVFRLGEPCRIKDVSWIKPGKVAWDWWNDWNIYGVDFRAGVNNETYKYYIDFAAEKGIEYVILDEGWAADGKADLMQVVPEIDIKELVAYGKERNVGVILWAGYWAFHKDMKNVVSHYSAMGIKGFKIDFMNRSDYDMVKFINDAAALCARYKMLIDFHGMYKPTGMQRTWPNVLNYEGVFGLEQLKWSQKPCDQVLYDVQIPFIRMFAGPMDYTQGAMRNATMGNYAPVYTEPMSQGTRCRQLAAYVIFDSPLNMLCDNPVNYRRENECIGFISAIPTIWDETLPLDGKVGEHISLARRHGDTWYIGAFTDWNKRDITFDLSFLETGNYEMELFKDGINSDRAACDYKREVVPVPANRKVTITLYPGGGCAARIYKK